MYFKDDIVKQVYLNSTITDVFTIADVVETLMSWHLIQKLRFRMLIEAQAPSNAFKT